jgi:DNA-binding transcriptional regulator YiaG
MTAPSELKVIREQMGYSVRNFAELLGHKPSTFQHCESGRRPAQYDQMLEEAKAAMARDQRFFDGLPERIEAVPMFLGEVTHD